MIAFGRIPCCAAQRAQYREYGLTKNGSGQPVCFGRTSGEPRPGSFRALPIGNPLRIHGTELDDLFRCAGQSFE